MIQITYKIITNTKTIILLLKRKKKKINKNPQVDSLFYLEDKVQEITFHSLNLHY